MDIPVRTKTKVGTCIRDEKPSLGRGACALRGMLDDMTQDAGESPSSRNLLEQNMITESASSQEPSIERKDVTTQESVTTCAHSSAHHAQLMDIALWSGLPEELQELVFAHLPWPQIYQVRILSKGWNQKLMSGGTDSQLKRACVRAQPKSFALVGPADTPGMFTLNMFDIASSRWSTLETYSGDDSEGGDIVRVSASDGGLVCFLTKVRSWKSKAPWFLSVCNPLTGVCKELPDLCGIVQHMIMLKLIMDCETMHYRVILVGYCKDPKVGNLVNVYHSETGQWTKATASSSGEMVYGNLYNLNLYRCKPAPCSYNFADGRVHERITNFPGNYADVQSDFVKDHLFLLKDGEPAGGFRTFCIEEYEAMHCGSSWTLLKEYPFSCLPRTAQHIQPDENMGSWIHFFACDGFLLLFQVLDELPKDDRRVFLWLYEFSKEEWRELPVMPRGNRLFIGEHQLCELRFDSVP